MKFLKMSLFALALCSCKKDDVSSSSESVVESKLPSKSLKNHALTPSQCFYETSSPVKLYNFLKVHQKKLKGYEIELDQALEGVLVTAKDSKSLGEFIKDVELSTDFGIYEVDRKSSAKVYDYTDVDSGEVDLEGLLNSLLDEKVFPYEMTNHEGDGYTGYVITKSFPEITLSDLDEAFAGSNFGGELRVRLTVAGGKKNEIFTGKLEKGIDQIAIVHSGKVLSLATMQADVLGRDFIISGLDSSPEASFLANTLMKAKDLPAYRIKRSEH